MGCEMDAVRQAVCVVVDPVVVDSFDSVFECTTMGRASGWWRPLPRSVSQGWHLAFAVCDWAHRGPAYNFLLVWYQIIAAL